MEWIYEFKFWSNLFHNANATATATASVNATVAVYAYATANVAKTNKFFLWKNLEIIIFIMFL